MSVRWNSFSIRRLIQDALREDEARRDVTSRTLIPSTFRLRAAIRAKQAGVVAGLPLAERLFKAMSPSCRVQKKVRDGANVRPGQTLLLVKGNARAILAAERPALNALQHLSGIATLTHQTLKPLKGFSTQLLDTRKTLPGWRELQKYAVSCGGGSNHRMSLGDALLVKENHQRIAQAGGVDWVKALHQTMKKRPRLSVQIEIQTQEDLRHALAVRPPRVLLDNLSVSKLKRMIRILRKQLPKTEIEISGGVRPQDVKRLARLGVERISMGCLTHSAPALDCSLDILHVDPA